MTTEDQAWKDAQLGWCSVVAVFVGMCLWLFAGVTP